MKRYLIPILTPLAAAEALTLLLECLMPVLSDLKLDLEVEAQPALVD